jgi:outer membrane protein assembly factor BamA
MGHRNVVFGADLRAWGPGQRWPAAPGRSQRRDAEHRGVHERGGAGLGMVRAMGPRWHRSFLLATGVSALVASGCYQVPAGRSAVASIDIEGVSATEEDDIKDRIATVESPKFLGLVRGFVYDYALFDRYALRRDLSRAERYLQARGYYEAKVRAARIVEAGNKVHVAIEVDEGEPVTVATVVIAGGEALDASVRRELSSAATDHVPPGGRFDQDEFAEAETAVRAALTSRGYAAATVTRRAEVDLAAHKAQLRFTVEPGPVARVGKITFTGLGTLDEDAVRRVFGLQEGELYSTDEIEVSRLALHDLGVFSTVEVDADLTDIDRTRIVPLIVRTEPAKLKTVLTGFGLQFDALKTNVHGLIGWRNANFLGDLRRFEIRFRPGLVLYPTRLPDVRPPRDLLFEQRLIATLRQPAFLERRTAGVTRAEYSVYPVLLPGTVDPENVAGYHELRSEVGLERAFGRLFASPNYGIQANFPFDYLGSTPGLQRILISYVDLLTHLDLRDNPIRTRRGLYIGNELQIAGGPLQGDADDVRIQPEIRGFIPLPRKATLAMRASVGFLFPRNYGDAAQQAAGGSDFDVGEELARDYQLLFFRGFFGGGPSSNRGYPLRGIGPHAPVPRRSPAGQSIAAAGCAEGATSCNLPTGGRSMWEANVEVRFVVSGPFSTAFFCDAGDVSPYAMNIRLMRPHLSCGSGARYDTPVGPIRLDVGYRFQGPLKYPEGAVGELDPPTFFGLPIGIAFGIGEAF